MMQQTDLGAVPALVRQIDSTGGRIGPAEMIDRLVPVVIQAHPDAVTEESMAHARGRLRVAMMEVAADPKSRLHECTAESWVVAMAKSAASGLFPGGHQPQAYLIKRGNQVHWQMSWRGAVDLAYRAGWILRAELVYAGDAFQWELGMSPRIVEHVPGPRDFDDADPVQEWEAIRHGYVVAEELATGRKSFAVMTRGQIEKRRARSEAWKAHEKNGSACPWSEWPGERAKATLIKYAQSRCIFPRDVLAAADAADAITLPEVRPELAERYKSTADAAIADASPFTPEEMAEIEAAELQGGAA